MTKSKQHSGHDHGGDNHKRHVSGDITVRGQLEVHAPPSVDEKHDAERKEDGAKKNRDFVVSAVTTLAVIAYAGLAAWQGCLTNQSVITARNSLQASIEASHLDQRAWIGLVYPVKTVDGQKLRVGTNVSFKIFFRNSGKSPAINISYDSEIIFRPPNEPIPDYDSDVKENTFYKLTGIHEASVIAPSGDQYITFPTSKPQPIFFGPKQFEFMEHDVTVMYIVGKATYNDVFAHTPQHHTKFCLVYDADTGELGTCPINNTMD